MVTVFFALTQTNIISFQLHRPVNQSNAANHAKIVIIPDRPHKQQIKATVMHSTTSGTINDLADNITNVETKEIGESIPPCLTPLFIE